MILIQSFGLAAVAAFERLGQAFFVACVALMHFPYQVKFGRLLLLIVAALSCLYRGFVVAGVAYV